MSREPLTTLVHLTLVGHTVPELREILRAYLDRGLTNLLVLRGDPPGDPLGDWTPMEDGLSYASELIEFIRSEEEFADFEIGIASFPEGHFRAPDLESDTRYTLAKLRAGVPEEQPDEQSAAEAQAADEISHNLEALVGTTEDHAPKAEPKHPVSETTTKFSNLQFGRNYDPTK